LTGRHDNGERLPDKTSDDLGQEVGGVICRPWQRLAGRIAWCAVVTALLEPASGCRRDRDGAPPFASSPASSPAASPLASERFEPAPIAAGETLPLVIFLHGLGGSAARLFQSARLGDFGRAHRAFVVAPDGTRDRSERRFWNAGAACCNMDRIPVDDVARLTALVDTWRARPGVDPRRVYVVGFSNGGFMAHRLACAAGDRLAAVASIAGAGPEPDEPCAVSSPIGVLEVHGDADPIVPYQGGRVFDDPALAPYPSMPAAMRGWSRRLGCPGATSEGPVEGPLGPSLRVLRYEGCARGGAELWTIAGGVHRPPWPALVDQVWGFLARWTKPR
jgi:polyhydroxybutyrate depolymerase